METKLLHYDEFTGLGDYFACMDYLDTCVKNDLPQFGIAFLEIDDLKYVDDYWGHEASDALIKEAACITNESFGKFGKVFRVNWGRFCVLIDTKTPDSDYNTAKEQFEKLMEIFNSKNTNHLEIQISHSFRICR
ncbi:MAG: diguanylate cyclase [Oscillospiraceae bacterium]|nr:diguanylate cyclase [Oscillospiraceae bacterium]